MGGLSSGGVGGRRRVRAGLGDVARVDGCGVATPCGGEAQVGVDRDGGPVRPVRGGAVIAVGRVAGHRGAPAHGDDVDLVAVGLEDRVGLAHIGDAHGAMVARVVMAAMRAGRPDHGETQRQDADDQGEFPTDGVTSTHAGCSFVTRRRAAGTGWGDSPTVYKRSSGAKVTGPGSSAGKVGIWTA